MIVFVCMHGEIGINEDESMDRIGDLEEEENFSLCIKNLVRQGNVPELKKALVNARDAYRILCREESEEEVYNFFRLRLLIGCGKLAQIALDEGVPYKVANKIALDSCELIETATELKQLDAIGTELLSRYADRISFFKYPRYSKYVRAMLAYIERNYDKKIALRDIAASVGLTPAYASCLFKKETGNLIKDTIHRVRIDKAIELLVTSSSTISELCRQIGYKRSNHFTRAFKDATGMTPTEFRKKRRTSCP